jgi:hypothetical protein
VKPFYLSSETVLPVKPLYLSHATCAATPCVIVAGGMGSLTVEVYEEALGKWRRLPCNLPHHSHLSWMGSALM